MTEKNMPIIYTRKKNHAGCVAKCSRVLDFIVQANAHILKHSEVRCHDTKPEN